MRPGKTEIGNVDHVAQAEKMHSEVGKVQEKDGEYGEKEPANEKDYTVVVLKRSVSTYTVVQCTVPHFKLG